MTRGAPGPLAWSRWALNTLERAQVARRTLLVRATAFWCGPFEAPPSAGAAAGGEPDRPLLVEADVGRYPEVWDLTGVDELPALALIDPAGELLGGPVPDTAAARATMGGGAGDRRKSGAPAELLTPEGMAGRFLEEFDWKTYGFGDVPRSPQPCVGAFLLQGGLRTGLAQAVKASTLMLDAMHKSEVHDHVDGGFFHAVRGRRWDDPATGKSLAMNAHMATAYAMAARALGRDDFERVARETVRYINGFLGAGESSLWHGGQAPDDEYYGRLQHRRTATKRPALEGASHADSCSAAVSALAALAICCGERELIGRAKLALREVYASGQGEDPPFLHTFADGQWGGETYLRDALAAGEAAVDLWCATGDRRWLDLCTEALSSVGTLATEPALSAYERGKLALHFLRMEGATRTAGFALAGRAALREPPRQAYMSKAARAAWGTALIAQRKGVLVVFGPPEDPLTREAMAACFALGPAVLSDKKAPHTAIACGGGEPNPVADKAGVERVVGDLINSPKA